MTEVKEEQCAVECMETDDQLLAKYGKENGPTETLQEKAVNFLRNSTKCSSSRLKSAINTTLPVTSWLPKYNIKENLIGDLVGGITVSVVHLPQGLAYGLLAGLAPINGLYVSFFPVLMYAIFGTTRQLSIGTFAVVSLMIAAVVDKHVPPVTCSTDPGAATTSFTLPATHTTDIGGAFSSKPPGSSLEGSLASCESAYQNDKLQIAIALSVSVAIIHFAMYIFRLGVITLYFSSHMVAGFTCGAAFHVLSSQIPKLLGLAIPRKTGILSVIYTIIDIFANITSTNWATVIVSVCCIVPLIVGKEINLHFKKKLPFPLPWEFVVVVCSTVASSFGYLNSNYNVDVVGTIPQGIKTSIPNAGYIGSVIVDAIPIAIVIFSVSISLSRLMSEKNAYEFDANQELLAYGFANTFGSFFHCYPAAPSLSRSLIWEETGGKTQITGLISSVVILAMLLWIGPVFEMLPQATLAAVVVVNLKRMLKQFEQLKPLWKVSKIDAVTWFVTWLAVVLLGVDLGLYIGIGFSLFTIALRTQIVSGSDLVSLKSANLYRSSKNYVGDVDKDILIFQFPSPIVYANKDRFKQQLFSALGFKPAFEVARQKKIKREKEKLEDKIVKQREEAVKRNKNLPEVINQSFYSENESDSCNDDAKSISMTSSPCNHSSVDMQSLDKEAFKVVILDMSMCSFIDNDGVKTLRTLLNNLSYLNIKLILAACSDDVRKCLVAGQLLEKSGDAKNGSSVFFLSVEKAVFHIRKSLQCSDNSMSAKSQNLNFDLHTQL